MMSPKLNRRGFFNMALALGAVVALPTAALAKSINRFSLSKSGYALKGYDTTAYFQAGKAINGKDATSVTYKGAKFRFASAADAALFKANPEAYEPQFGGYCTRAMSLRKEVPGDPEIWRLHNGKLYVFFAPVGGKKFDQGRDAMIVLAQKHWDSLTLVG